MPHFTALHSQKCMVHDFLKICQIHATKHNTYRDYLMLQIQTSSSAITERPRCRLGQFWVGGGWQRGSDNTLHSLSVPEKVKALIFYTISPLLYEKRSLCVFEPLLGLASQASRGIPQMAIHTASRVYSVSIFTFHMKVSIHTAILEIVHAHRVRPVTGLMAQKAALGSV